MTWTFLAGKHGKPLTISFLSLQFYHWIMNGLHRPLLPLVCVLLVILSGCTSPAIGDALYRNGGISVNLTSSTDIPGAWMQVTIYQINELHQRELLVVNSPVTLRKGENEVFIPVPLEQGTYKLYVYLIQNGERKTAVIRDIVV